MKIFYLAGKSIVWKNPAGHGKISTCAKDEFSQMFQHEERITFDNPVSASDISIHDLATRKFGKKYSLPELHKLLIGSEYNANDIRNNIDALERCYNALFTEQESVYTLSPITSEQQDVINALREHDIVIVDGQTGSGKTSLVFYIAREFPSSKITYHANAPVNWVENYVGQINPGSPEQIHFDNSPTDILILDNVRDMSQLEDLQYKKLVLLLAKNAVIECFPDAAKCTLTKSLRLTNDMQKFLGDTFGLEFDFEEQNEKSVAYISQNMFHPNITLIEDAYREYGPDELMILVPMISENEGNPTNILLRTLATKHIDFCLGNAIVPGRVPVMLYGDAIGFERKAVVLYNLDAFFFQMFPEFAPDKCPEPIYIAATRASEKLIIFQGTNPPEFVRNLDPAYVHESKVPPREINADNLDISVQEDIDVIEITCGRAGCADVNAVKSYFLQGEQDSLSENTRDVINHINTFIDSPREIINTTVVAFHANKEISVSADILTCGGSQTWLFAKTGDPIIARNYVLACLGEHFIIYADTGRIVRVSIKKESALLDRIARGNRRGGIHEKVLCECGALVVDMKKHVLSKRHIDIMANLDAYTTCECGAKVRPGSLSAHRKTKGHLARIKN